jgi:hypothetical protein
VTGLNLWMLADPAPEILGKLGVLPFDMYGDKCLDGMPQRGFIQVDRKILDNATVDQCFDATLDRAR